MLASRRVAIAQLNPVVGDITGNAAKILHAYEQARAQGAELVICPECSLIGYPPEDLVLMPDFRAQAMQAVQELAARTADGAALIIGTVREEDGQWFNAALLLDGSGIAHIQRKTMLPNYGVFDEKRVFAAGHGAQPFRWRGHRLALLVCEDIWQPELVAQLSGQQVELLIVINASPFEAGKLAQRRQVAAHAAAQAGCPILYANLVGGQDDLVFDGGSFVLSARGEVLAQLPEFCEALAVLTPENATFHPLLSTEETLWQAMALGLRDYVEKNGFPGIVLGLSGGIDSALAAALAVDALGSARVKGVLLHSPYTSKESVEDALRSATLLGIETMTIPISPAMEIFNEVLSPVFRESGWMENPALGGNVQARLRGITLMALSNRFGWMLLNTSNKSEIAVGYSTLYGDACGGFAILKDLYKTQVYALARWRNAQSAAIPPRSIEKPPSAELKPGQTDQDQLPPYDLLDAILQLHIEGRCTVREIIAQGYAPEVVERIVKLVRLSEYKRRQAPPGVKLSPMLFGKERRFPLTNRF